MTLITFAILYNHHHYLFPKFFDYPKQKPCSHNCHSLFPHPPGISNWFSSFRNVPILNTTYKWNYAVVVPLGMAISVSRLSSRFIHDVACIETSFLFWTSNIQLYGYTVFSLSIHLLGHLGCPSFRKDILRIHCFLKLNNVIHKE